MQVGKQHAASAGRTTSAAAAAAAQAAGVAAIEGVVKASKGEWYEAKRLSSTLRKVPEIDLHVPTLALIGAPNVGKSSLVAVLSSGTPEVCNYPFTTRSVKMGHFYVNQIRHQVTDTPGVLDRPSEERNAMERLTLATLEHLPTAAVFVLDLTEGCGCSVQEQWRVRAELRARFPATLWIDVLSKADLLEEELDAAAELETAGSMEASGAAPEPADAVDAALHVSAVTHSGLGSLKAAVLALMEDPSWASRIRSMHERDSSAFATADEDVSGSEELVSAATPA